MSRVGVELRKGIGEAAALRVRPRRLEPGHTMQEPETLDVGSSEDTTGVGLSEPQRARPPRRLAFDAFLEQPLSLVRSFAPPRTPLGAEGMAIGKYRLISRLAQGAFGEVWQ